METDWQALHALDCQRIAELDGRLSALTKIQARDVGEIGRLERELEAAKESLTSAAGAATVLEAQLAETKKSLVCAPVTVFDKLLARLEATCTHLRAFGNHSIAVTIELAIDAIRDLQGKLAAERKAHDIDKLSLEVCWRKLEDEREAHRQSLLARR